MTTEDWKFINTFAPWFSAIGTFLAVVVSLYLSYTSRRQKLKPSASIMIMLTQGQKEEVYPKYVWLRVTNIGHTKVKIINIGWNVGFFKKRTFLQTNPKNIYSSEIPILLDEGEEASWIIDINDEKWLKDFYNKTLNQNLWNLWSLRFIVYTSKNKSFNCKVDKSFKDKMKEIASIVEDKKVHKVKRQHYVPQFYLKRWARDISSIQIWVYDKNLKKAFSNNIQSVASSNYFYDFPEVSQKQMDEIVKQIDEEIKDENKKAKALQYLQIQMIEKAFSEIEAINSEVLKNIIQRIEDVSVLPIEYFLKHHFIRVEDIVELSLFIALQYTRTTEIRIVVEQMTESFVKHIADTMIDNIDKVAQDDELKEKLGEESFTEYIDSVKSGKFVKNSFTVSIDEKYTKLNHLKLIFDSAEDIEKIIKYYKWVLCINDSEIPFFTCDNPVVKKANLHHPFYSNGFNSKGIEIYYPISPKYAICVIEPSYLKENASDLMDRTVWKFSKENVIHYNDLIVKNATSQIYSNKNDFSWVEKRLSDTPSVGDKNRKRISFGSIGDGR